MLKFVSDCLIFWVLLLCYLFPFYLIHQAYSSVNLKQDFEVYSSFQGIPGKYTLKVAVLLKIRYLLFHDNSLLNENMEQILLKLFQFICFVHFHIYLHNLLLHWYSLKFYLMWDAKRCFLNYLIRKIGLSPWKSLPPVRGGGWGWRSFSIVFV